MKKRTIARLLLASIAALALVSGLAALAGCGEKEPGRILVTVNAEGWDAETSTPIAIAVYEGDQVEALADEDEGNDPEPVWETDEIGAGEAYALEPGEAGVWTVAVTAAPVLSDGTIYALPEEAQAVTLEDEDVEIAFDLEPIDLSKADAETVEKALEAAEAAGGADAVAAARASASEAGKAGATPPSANPGGNDGGGGGQSPGGGGGQQPGHTHSWTYHAAVTHEEPVYESLLVCSCGQTFSTNAEWTAHNRALGPGNGHSYSVQNVQTGTRTVTDQAAYYSCSCGATKPA